jgi:hypothetical protein
MSDREEEHWKLVERNISFLCRRVGSANRGRIEERGREEGLTEVLEE